MLAYRGYLRIQQPNKKYYKAKFQFGWSATVGEFVLNRRYSLMRFKSASEAVKYGLAVEQRYNHLRAVRGKSMGLANDQEVAVKLADIAIKQGADMGKNPSQSFDDFITYLTNKEKKPRVVRAWFQHGEDDPHKPAPIVFSTRILVGGDEEEQVIKSYLEKNPVFLGMTGDLESCPEYEDYLKRSYEDFIPKTMKEDSDDI